jgi:hypothetical protein
MIICLQNRVFYYIINGAHDPVPLLEQKVDDGFTTCDRWNARTVKIVGTIGTDTAVQRLQGALVYLNREWCQLDNCPLYYLTLIASHCRLPGLDHLVQSTPPELNCNQLVGRLCGTPGMSQLINVLLTVGHTAHCLPM